MMSQNDQMENIERYLSDEMNELERLAFEKAMEVDIRLAEEVKSQKVIKDLVFDKGILNLKEKLVEVENLEKARVRRNFRWYFYAVIGMLVITGVLLIINSIENDRKVMNSKNTGSEKVYYIKMENNKPEIKVEEEKIANNVKQTDKNIVIGSSVTIKEKEQIKENSNIKVALKDSIEPPTVDKVNENNVTVIDNHKDLSQNNNKQIKEVVDCKSTYITAEVITQKTCKNQKQGKIIVDLTSVKGGVGPYSYSMREYNDFSSNGSFVDLAEGSYKVYIKDKNGCTGIINNIFVGTENCVKSQNYSISPDYGEEWKIPMEESQDGVLSIFDQAGREVYKLQFTNGMPDVWDGSSNDGIILNRGAYYYEIRYDTGNTMTGYISIIR